MLEMHIVVREVLRRHRLLGSAERPERARRRSITLSPGRGANVVLGAA